LPKSNLNDSLPKKIYYNFKLDKNIIFKDHKIRLKVSGVYCFINLINGNYYIGSSSNLAIRFRNYLNSNYLINKKNSNQPIIKAFIKYGYSNFALIIIEYIPVKETLNRESLLIENLNPYYNVLKIAGSSLGFKHSSSTKLIMANLAKNRKVSDKTKKKISESLKGELNPFFNKNHSAYSINKIIISKSLGKIYIYDYFYNFLVIFPSLTTFSKLVKSNNSTINKLISNGLLFRGK
jgi:group I intron endonuclease